MRGMALSCLIQAAAHRLEQRAAEGSLRHDGYFALAGSDPLSVRKAVLASVLAEEVGAQSVDEGVEEVRVYAELDGVAASIAGGAIACDDLVGFQLGHYSSDAAEGKTRSFVDLASVAVGVAEEEADDFSLGRLGKQVDCVDCLIVWCGHVLVFLSYSGTAKGRHVGWSLHGITYGVVSDGAELKQFGVGFGFSSGTPTVPTRSTYQLGGMRSCGRQPCALDSHGEGLVADRYAAFVVESVLGAFSETHGGLARGVINGRAIAGA
jgi:hypothetical protein